LFRIPVYQPSLSGNEKKYVNECLDSTWISSKGKFVSQFEVKFARVTGNKYAASVCNGTVALHLALSALGIGPGDEVIVPTLTFVASVNAVTYTGAKPVFVDSLASTWQMDPADVRRKITPKTRGIIAVHLYGHPCDMDSLIQIAKEHNLLLIEDCAEALGSYYKGKHVGTFGHIASYSFYGNKTITTGEGGMVVTDNETLYRRSVHLKGQGLSEKCEYWHDMIGYNYRMTNICAAIGLAQLEQAAVFLEKKRWIAKWYKEGFKDIPVVFHEEIGDVKHSFWMCSILVRDPIDRDPLRNVLKENGIETRPLFYPIHTMPMYSQKVQQCPIAENLSSRGINLPSWPGLTKSQVDFICRESSNYFGN
jgi:perosamine synthetase